MAERFRSGDALFASALDMTVVLWNAEAERLTGIPADEALKTRVLPRLMQGRSRQDPLRIWSIGCSTGEEAYSLAILVAEYLAEVSNALPVQVYATDLNGAAIDRARLGFYPKSIMHDVSPERLRAVYDLAHPRARR